MPPEQTRSHARAPAVSLEEALERAAALAPATATERVELSSLPGRRLARAVTARAPIPPFSNSAMDGYAVRAADTPGTLRLAGESAAGHGAATALAPGQACRISTGAPLPAGADGVVRQEDVRADATEVHVGAAVAPGADVRHRAEDVAEGDVLLPAGHVVAPHEAGVVAAAGHSWALCFAPVRAAILVTGDELTPPGAPLEAGTVYDSNSYGVAAQAHAAGATVTVVARVADDADATRSEVGRLLGDPGDDDAPDMLITLGGLSVGPHDHVRPALAAAGVREVVPRVRARPGQPTWIGTRGRQVVLALPGNPVSAAVCFHIFGRALLGRPVRWDLRAPLARGMRTSDRLAQLMRCRLGPDGAEPLAHQGSGAISSLAGVDVLAWLPADGTWVDAGTPVPIAAL